MTTAGDHDPVAAGPPVAVLAGVGDVTSRAGGVLQGWFLSFLGHHGLAVTVALLVVICGMTVLGAYLLREIRADAAAARLQDGLLAAWNDAAARAAARAAALASTGGGGGGGGGGGVLADQFAKIHVVANPKAGTGHGRAMSDLLGHLLQDEIGASRLDVGVTKWAGHGSELASAISVDPNVGSPAFERPQLIIVLGGDGTVHEVINGALLLRASGTDPAQAGSLYFYVAPLGGANKLAAARYKGLAQGGTDARGLVASFAALLKYGRYSAAKLDVLHCRFRNANGGARSAGGTAVLSAAPAAAAAAAAAASVCSTEQRFVVTGITWGVIADFERLVAAQSQSGLWRYVRWDMGARAAALASLLASGRFRCGGTVRFTEWGTGESRTLHGPFAAVVIANSTQSVAGIEIAPGAALDDGKIHLMVVDASSRFDAAKFALAKLVGRLGRMDGVTVYTCTSVAMDPAPGTWMLADGEQVPAAPFEATIRPGYLNIVG